MLGIMLGPTGIGAAIGGHSGDATGAACVLAAACDRLIVHPNIANASDLYAMPDNVLYVEGSMIDSMLSGSIGLRPIIQNRILVVCNEMNNITSDAVNAARSIHGVNAQVEVLHTPLIMLGGRDGRAATGEILGTQQLVRQLKYRVQDFDAVAIHTPVGVDDEVVWAYQREGGINPWGGVEAMLTRNVSAEIGKPCAHAPLEINPPTLEGTTVAGLAPEMICASHLVSVLAGLNRAPRRVNKSDLRGGEVTINSVAVIISALCYGDPHRHAHKAGLPIIWVEENTTTQRDRWEVKEGDVVCANYLEAAGHLLAMRIGRSPNSARAVL